MTSNVPVIELDAKTLAHFGVKGMKWGVRKVDAPTYGVKSEGIRVGSDGSISIDKGASLQRLVRSNGKSLPMKDITYASFTDYDNNRYVKVIGGKGILGSGRDQILSIEATKPIKAPSFDESTKITSELLLKDAEFRKNATNMLGVPIQPKQLKEIEADPTGKMAKLWNQSINTSLTYDAEFDPGSPYVQKAVREKFVEKGYNAVRDENDYSSGIAKAPIIVFNPETSLRVVSKTDIDDALRAATKERLKEYKARGKDWAERELYE